jgi:hypothetical protein
MRNQSHRLRPSPIELSNAAPKVRLAGTHPTVGGALPVILWKLKVVMETLLVLMVVATAGLMLAHGFAIVKRLAEGR